jgi:hypothetical protein
MGTVAVIGAGLAGQIVARTLASHGRQPIVYDPGCTYSGTAASSNLFANSWVKKWAKDGRAGIEHLHNLFPNTVGMPFMGVDVRRVSMEPIGVVPRRVEDVVDAGNAVVLDDNSFHDYAVLCVGWRSSLVDSVKVGHALRFVGECHKPIIETYAPFKQVKIFQESEGVVYFGDSTAVNRENYNKRQDELLERSMKLAAKYGLTGEPEITVGYRPVVNAHPYGVMKKDGRVFHINGGGKNGLVAYAARALEMIQCM